MYYIIILYNTDIYGIGICPICHGRIQRQHTVFPEIPYVGESGVLRNDFLLKIPVIQEKACGTIGYAI